MTESPIKRRALVAYSAPTFAEQIMIAPVFGILPTLYAEKGVVTLATAGLLFTIARLLDSVSDPLIGILSDQTKTKWGARKPWIAAGCITAIVAIYFFYIPQPGAGPVYFFVWSNLLLLGWTMLTIPYNAWATELTGSYFERSRIFAYRNFIGGVGGFLFALSPLLLLQWTGNTEFSFSQLSYVAYGLIFAFPVFVGIALYAVPQGRTIATAWPSPRAMFDAVRKNRVMWRYVCISIFGALGQGFFFGLEFLFITHYLKLGPQYFILASVFLATGLVSIPLWLPVVKRFGKHKAWAASNFIFAATVPILFFLEPGTASLPILLAFTVIRGLLQGSHAVAPQAMLADLIDYDTFKTGANQAGLYFSFLTFLSKSVLAVGSGMALAIVGLFGFEVGLDAVNSDSAVTALRLTLCVIPAILAAGAALLLLNYPLTERRQNIIRKRLERRAMTAGTRSIAT